jgi:hypothetical protein
MNGIEKVIDLLARGQRVNASEREQAQFELARLNKIAARVAATDHGGASRSQNIRRLVVDGDLDVPTGTVRIGPVAANKGNLILASGGIKLRTNTTPKIDLQSDGDVFIGEDTSAPAKTYLSVFVNAQTYNGEAMSAGDMLWGDNSASKANMLFDKSAGELLLRGGTTSNVKLTTGGAIAINADGGGYLLFLDGTTTIASIIGEDVAGTALVTISTGTSSGTGYGGQLDLRALNSAGTITSKIEIRSSGTITVTNTVTEFSGDIDVTSAKWLGLGAAAGRLVFTDAATDTLDLEAATLNPKLGVNVGTATGAGTGEVRATQLTAYNSGGEGSHLGGLSGSLANGTAVTLSAAANGLLCFRDGPTNSIEWCYFGYGAAPAHAFGAAIFNFADALAQWRFFWDAGDSTYKIRNSTGTDPRGYTLYWLAPND